MTKAVILQGLGNQADSAKEPRKEYLCKQEKNLITEFVVGETECNTVSRWDWACVSSSADEGTKTKLAVECRHSPPPLGIQCSGLNPELGAW